MPDPDAELQTKLELLTAEHPRVDPPNAHLVAERYYGILTILDSKASALFAFDGILTAAAAFNLDRGAKGLPYWLTLAAMGAALLAATACLTVARISYRFLGEVTVKSPGTLDYGAENANLCKEVGVRTHDYRIAWWLSLGAVLLFLIALALSPIMHP